VEHAYRIRKGPHGTALFLTNDEYEGLGLCSLVWRREIDGAWAFQLVHEGSLAECIAHACFALSPAEFSPWND
jgi:hypothetical protein